MCPRKRSLILLFAFSTLNSGLIWAFDVEIPTHGGRFMGTTERFNRHVTDPDYRPTRSWYVSPDGEGSGAKGDPTNATRALSGVKAGQEVIFLPGQYNGCWELDEAHSGTYEEPIIIRGERNLSTGRSAHIRCCNSGRRACFNLEGANHIAIEGFTLEGGSYGVRAVGLGHESAAHQVGIAISDNEVFDQYRDPLFSGQSDWMVVQGNVAHGAGSGDGHGIYLSNGGDWMIIRDNELFDNASSDFQINADPESTCRNAGVDYRDPVCDGSARQGLGQGVSEFILVENNYFHNGYHNTSSGPNFTSVRNSIVRGNIFAFYSRHGTSFWQETENPKLGSSENQIHHNLFIGETRNRHVLQFINHSDHNEVHHNVLLGVTLSEGAAEANSHVILVEADETSVHNHFRDNIYIGGHFSGHLPSSREIRLERFDPAWFQAFPFDRMGAASSFRQADQSPLTGNGPSP